MSDQKPSHDDQETVHKNLSDQTASGHGFIQGYKSISYIFFKFLGAQWPSSLWYGGSSEPWRLFLELSSGQLV